MGMMSKMRSLAPWFIITVGGLFVVFMVLSDAKVTDIVGQRSQFIGSVNGTDITYQEFSNFFEQARANRQAQTGQDIGENEMEMFRNQVWDAVINQKLMEDKIREFGIEVSDQEVKDVILGENPPAFLKQSFIDSTGRFNRDLYLQVIMDPNNVDQIIQAEQAVRADLIQKKLESFLYASISVTDEEVKQKFIDENIRMTAQYALIESNSFADSLVSVTDDEIENYYNEYKEDYKTEEMKKVEYVIFRKKASKRDSSDIMKNLEAIVEKLKKDTSSFKTYVDIYSDTPYSKDTLAINRLPKESQVIVNAKAGDIIGPILTFEGATVVRYLGKVKSKDPSVKASHILVSLTGRTEDEAKAKADSVYNALRAGADFETTAKEVSEDPGSGAKGGDLGWFGKGQMVKPFEDAAFSGRVNRIQRPVKSRFGYHIIKVTDKSSNDYIIEKIVNQITPSATTLDKLFDDASDFAFLADRDGFEESAEMLKLNIQESPAFEENTTNIPGVGSNHAMTYFVFDNGVGSVSDVFRISAGYAVVKVSEEIPAGYKPLEDVTSSIKRNLINDKKKEKAMSVAAEVYSKISASGNLGEAGAHYNKTKVARAENFTASGSIRGVGKDYAFVNYTLKAEVGKISEPIKGNRGAFLIKLINRTNFDSTSFVIQKNNLRDALLNTKKSAFISQWMTSIKEDADITDNRHMFYN